MTFLSIKFRHIPVKPYVISWKKPKNVYTPFRVFIKEANNFKEKNSINQIEDNPKVFICMQNNISNIHTFSEIISYYLNSLDERIIIQKVDKLKGFIRQQFIDSSLYTFSKNISYYLNSLDKCILNQKADKPKRFICTQYIDSSLHTFSKILYDYLNNIDKRIFNQKADKLLSINQRQQIVECVILSPLKA